MNAMKFEWKLDPSDFSWWCRDVDGTMFRVSRVFDGNGFYRWVIAWQESKGVRLGAYSYSEAEKAKEAALELFARAA